MLKSQLLLPPRGLPGTVAVKMEAIRIGIPLPGNLKEHNSYIIYFNLNNFKGYFHFIDEETEVQKNYMT